MLTLARIVKAPETIETARLLLRKPSSEDAADIFQRYASDAEVPASNKRRELVLQINFSYI